MCMRLLTFYVKWLILGLNRFYFLISFNHFTCEFVVRKMTLSLDSMPKKSHSLYIIYWTFACHIIWLIWKRQTMGFLIKVYRHERLIIITDWIEQEMIKAIGWINYTEMWWITNKIVKKVIKTKKHMHISSEFEPFFFWQYTSPSQCSYIGYIPNC